MPPAPLPANTIDVVALGADPTGARDSTAAFKTAAARAATIKQQTGAPANYHWPTDSEFLVKFNPGTFRIAVDLRNVRQIPDARIVLAADQTPLARKADGTPDDRSAIVLGKDLHCSNLEIDGQAALQTKHLADGLGTIYHGLRLQGDTDADVTAKIINARGETSAGPGETFHFQSLGGDGGRYSVQCLGGATDPVTGRVCTATGAVVQGRRAGAAPFLIHNSIASSMGIGQGFGMFGGGNGRITNSAAYNCRNAALNVESGTTPGSVITADNFEAEACDRGLAVNGNLGTTNASVTVTDSEFRGMRRGMWLVGLPVSGLVTLRRVLLEGTYAAIDFGPRVNAATMRDRLVLDDVTYRLLAGGAQATRTAQLTTAQLAEFTRLP